VTRSVGHSFQEYNPIDNASASPYRFLERCSSERSSECCQAGTQHKSKNSLYFPSGQGSGPVVTTLLGQEKSKLNMKTKLKAATAIHSPSIKM